jgi:hypothetical protein
MNLFLLFIEIQDLFMKNTKPISKACMNLFSLFFRLNLFIN